MYISKYLSSCDSGFDVWWMFIKGADMSQLNPNEHHVTLGSLKHLYVLNTSEFLITNQRTRPRDFLWKKKRGQKYLMTWHGSMPLKKIEKDAMDSIGSYYVNIAKEDSKICDLMLSDSKFFTNLIRTSFWYNGEILETSLPRNQKFFEKESSHIIRKKILKHFGETDNENTYLVLYAPTFRSNNSIDSYITEWWQIRKTIEFKYGKRVVVLMRLHPNLLQVINTDTLINEDFVKNASHYSDMQELMVASDMLITDYSSTMYEFSLMNKPCFLYMPDKETYDRDLYFNLSDIPFAQSSNLSELISEIKNYCDQKYQQQIHTFIDTNFGLYKQTNGSAKVCEWMKHHSIR